MPARGFIMKGPGWQRLKIALDPKKFRGRVKAQFSVAMARAGKEAEAQVRRVIKSAPFLGNRPLTMAIKKSSKPLVDQGDLYGAITSQVLSYNSAFVGVLKTNANYNVALAIHEGVLIPVTPKMRSMFWHLWLKSEVDPGIELTGRAAELWARFQGPWYPIGFGTKVIVIPSRPFIKAAFRSRTMRRRVREIWAAALQRAMA